MAKAIDCWPSVDASLSKISECKLPVLALIFAGLPHTDFSGEIQQNSCHSWISLWLWILLNGQWFLWVLRLEVCQCSLWTPQHHSQNMEVLVKWSIVQTSWSELNKSLRPSSTILGTVDVVSGTYFATNTSNSSPNPCACGASASKIIAHRIALGFPGKNAKNFKIDLVSSGIIWNSSENSWPKAFQVFLSQ